MSGRTYLAAIAIGVAGFVLPGANAGAQCIDTAEQTQLASELRAAFARSSLSLDQLYHIAANRLGYGWAGPIEGRSRAALADAIATQFRAIGTEPTTRIERISDAEDDGRRPWRFAKRSMRATFTELRRLQDLRTMAVDAFNAANASDPNYEELRRAATAAKQAHAQLRRDLRETASAQIVSMALSGPNMDLGAVLTEFWWNHFNVDGAQVYWSHVDYRRRIRRQGCNTFRGLLRTTAQHPAMLTYLNNNVSRRGSINENYARELMELHTFGNDEDQYYTQQDVVEAARALTGWTLRNSTANGDYDPRFHFSAARHDYEELTLFAAAPSGTTLVLPAATRGSPDGVERGEALLSYLASHAETRRNICRKLAQRLVGRSTPALVNECASTGVWGNGGDLSAIYQVLITSDELWSPTASGGWASGWKNPLELAVSAHRAARYRPAGNARAIRGAIEFANALGQSIGHVGPPTGYPDGRYRWVSSSQIVAWQRYLFEHIATHRLSMTMNVGGTPTDMQGDALEDQLARSVANARGLATAARNDRLNSLGRRIVRTLGLPSERFGETGAFRVALLRADDDARRPDPAPYRSAVHAYLGSPGFLKK